MTFLWLSLLCFPKSHKMTQPMTARPATDGTAAVARGQAVTVSFRACLGRRGDIGSPPRYSPGSQVDQENRYSRPEASPPGSGETVFSIMTP